MRGSHGWAEVARERKREIIGAIVATTPTSGPSHIELDLTDRCNVACYFCNQQDLRTREQLPLQRTTDLIDELAATGLKSVRMSGGGDPLFHREVGEVLDHLAARGVVVDNLTTNGVALTPEIARCLIENRAREIIFSLDAVDAADYARMLQVKPALFDRVLANIRMLVAERGPSIHPSIVVQFLLDRRNFTRMVEMYDLAGSLGADRIAFNLVQEIPRQRIDRESLLTKKDAALAEPHFEEVLRRDRERGLLQIDFSVEGWNEMAARVRMRTGGHPSNSYPTAPSFRDANGGCFFAWYTAAITGNGDIRPCCLLLSPDVPPLGNIHDRSLSEQWRGEVFQTMRCEMREVLLRKGKVSYSRKSFKVLEPACVRDAACWLKNMYFRGDEEFYAELGAALDEARRKELRWFGSAAQFRRRTAMLLYDILSKSGAYRLYDRLRNASRPLRIALKKRLHVNLTDAA